MNTTTYSAAETAALLPFPALVQALEQALLDYAANRINAPERQVVALPAGGVMLSMPCTAHDLSIHKLVNVVPSNAATGFPTINGVVSVYESSTGRTRAILDGPTVTARRTAALSMLGIQTLMPGMCPRHAVLIGTGTQATGHAQALAALYPGLKVTVVGSRPEKAQAFVTALHALSLELDLQPGDTVPHDADVVITLTTSAHPVYSEPARSDRLVVGVGAFKPELAEIAPDTLHASQIYVDDLAGARHEAGDIIQANCSWDSVLPLAHALEHGTDTLKPRVFKTVGCAAWDLAAARCALLAKHT